MSNYTIFSAKTALAAYDLPDGADELGNCSGYICDCVTEIADGLVSIYTADNIQAAHEYRDEAAEAVAEGLALSGRDYFEHYPNNDFDDYTAHVGAVAEFVHHEREIYDALADALEYAALEHIAGKHGDALVAEAWEAARLGIDDDNNGRIEDVLSNALAAYDEAIGVPEADAA